MEICNEKQFTIIELNSYRENKNNFKVKTKEHKNTLSFPLINKSETDYKNDESLENSSNKDNNDIEIDNKTRKNNTLIKKKKKSLNIIKDNIKENEQNPEIVVTNIFQKFIKNENMESLKMNYEI